jgi:hypothetical protein
MTDADRALLQKRLAEAEEALHRLLTGSQEEASDYNGFRTTFTAANTGDLRLYINQLKRQLGIGGRRGSIRT